MSDFPNTLLKIEASAHGGAFGNNPLPEPTESQCMAGNYKMGRVSLYGLPIAIEQPRGSYRSGIDQKTGKRWTSRVAAHYGYINGTKAADEDCMDCFIGVYPQSETIYVINQFIDGRFDEHKSMLGFPDENSARGAYLNSYERGWKGMESVVPMSISQFKWWLKNGEMSHPVRAENLPYEGLETMTKRVQWNSEALPIGIAIDQLLYQIRQSEESGNLLPLDSVTVGEIIGDSDGMLALDALVTPYAKLNRKMELLRGVMERTGNTVKPVAMQITDPFKQLGRTNVAAIFELSDGQTVSIFFHNPDVTPNKILPTDDLISWKWLLNKKDITIVVAPERGEDLNIREVSRRIMKLAEKNSAAFARANQKRSQRMESIQSLKTEISGLEQQLESVQRDFEVAKLEYEERINVPKPKESANLDPTKPEDYAKVMADPELQLNYQDVLDSFFQERIVAVRNALRDLGWGGEQYSWPMTKGLYSLDANVKHLGGGKNVVGVSYIVKDGNDFHFETGDSLSKTPEQIAAVIDSSVVIEKTLAETNPDVEQQIKNLFESGKILDAYKLANNDTETLEVFANRLFGDDYPPLWDLPTEVIRNMTADEFSAASNALEDWNHHSQNVVLLAKRKGTEKDIKDAQDFLKFHEESGGLSFADIERRNEIENRLSGDDETRKLEDLSIEVRELLSNMGWKGFDDGSVMTIGNYRASISGNYAGFSVEMNDLGSGTWDEVGFMSMGLDKSAQYIAEGIARIVDSRQRNKKSASSSGSDEHVNALQSIVDGKHDGDNLTELLNKIVAASAALSDAGLADQHDQLIGAAAEKWAQLDQIANG